MKNLFKLFLPTALCLFAFNLLVSCDDKDQPKDPDQLPDMAQVFIADYFGGQNITKVTYDEKNKDWEVYLDNGTSVTFDKDGNWTEVEAPALKTIPFGIAPEPIGNYIKANYDGYGINEIEKNSYRYEVVLTNGQTDGPELFFSLSGEYQGSDMD